MNNIVLAKVIEMTVVYLASYLNVSEVPHIKSVAGSLYFSDQCARSVVLILIFI